jgi:hypothetical protein
MAVIEYVGGRRMTWWDLFSLQFVRYFAAVLALGLIVWGVHAELRDRPTLQWPGVSGTVEKCKTVVYHTTRHTHHYVDITYAYTVSGRRYEGHRIAMWNEDWDNGDSVWADLFIAEHPIHSAVDVYYDPEHPESAVLIRGPDELGNRISIWGGSVALAGGIWWIWLTREKAAEVRARLRQER